MIRKTAAALLGLCLWQGSASAQSMTSPNFSTVAVANAGTTGTTVNKLAKLTGAPSTAVISGTSDTAGILGVVVADAGTTGSAKIAIGGLAFCVLDGATTSGNVVINSPTVTGNCHDSGQSDPKLVTGQVVGKILTTNGSGGTYPILLTPSSGFSSFGTAAYQNTGTSGANLPFANGTNTWANAQTFTAAPVFTDQSGSRTALGLGTAATQNTGTSGATLPFLNGTNTWANAQTFTVAPVFTDQSGTRTALGLGTAATQNTGTSGATLGFLNGNNTSSGTQNFTGTFQIGGNTQTFPATAATLTQTVASGTSALGTGATSSGSCATVVTTSATGTLTTDVIEAVFNGDPTAVTGYTPSTSGMLTIIPYPTSGNVNFKVCNNTSSSITPGAITLNWRVVR